MDDTVVALDIGGEGRTSSKVIGLSNNGIINKGLAELAAVGDGLSLDSLHVSTDGARGDLALDDVVLENISRDVAPEAGHGRVAGQKDGEGARASEEVHDTIGVGGGSELGKVIVSFEVVLTLSLRNTIGTPDHGGALKRGDGVGNVGVKRRRRDLGGAESGRRRKGSTRSGGEGNDGETERDHC